MSQEHKHEHKHGGHHGGKGCCKKEFKKSADNDNKKADCDLPKPEDAKPEDKKGGCCCSKKKDKGNCCD